MIGLSLSFCIRDIMSGDNVRIKDADGQIRLAQVLETDVTKIITNTCLRTETDWEDLYERYGQVYWRAFEAGAVIALVKRFLVQDKIEQPRLLDPEYGHSIQDAHWIV
jgi:hypothetical protein